MITYILIAIIVGLIVFVALLLKKPQGQDQSVMMFQQQLESLRTQMAESLKTNTESVNHQLVSIIDQVNKQLSSVTTQMISSQKNVGDRLDNAARVVADVQKGLGTLTQASQQIFEVGKDIASLQEILRAPKLRGGLGEFFLGDLLGQILPSAHFTTQFSFRSGEKVDAVIKLGGSLVPVDSKFPLENFKRMLEGVTEDDKNKARRQFVADVKKHIDAIATKYILPDEGTYDFALMYIPAENVYYETIIKDDAAGGDRNISQYALSKKVIPVSPNSFYAYLQAIVLGLKGMKIEERAKEIIQYLGRLEGDFSRFKEEFNLVGKHIGHAQSSFQSADKRLDQFGQKLLAAEAEKKGLPES